MSGLDPAAIMAAHQDCGEYSEYRCGACDKPWPCLPYRLAAEVERWKGIASRMDDDLEAVLSNAERAEAALAERDAQISAVRALSADDTSGACVEPCGACAGRCDQDGMRLYLYPAQVRAALGDRS